jgi:hypothetical protein
MRLSGGCQEAVRGLSGGCQRRVLLLLNQKRNIYRKVYFNVNNVKFLKN